jgi:hypothetical protein
MDCVNLLYVLLAIAAIPALMALGVLTRLMWHMIKGNGGWR